MTVQAFVDESRRGRSYLVCAVVVEAEDLARSRVSLRGMLLSGQRRLHFATESDRRRKSILAEMAKLPVRVWVYVSGEKEPLARRRSIDALLQDLDAVNGERLVIERREISQDAREKSQIAEAKRLGQAPARLTYTHLGASEEPLLWIADAVAWAYGAGGNWRQRAAELIEQVKDVGSCHP